MRRAPGTRPVAPELTAVPTLTLGLTTALRLYRGARADPPDFLTAAAATLIPGSPVTAWVEPPR